MRIIEVKLRQDYSVDWIIVKSATGHTYTLSSEQIKDALVSNDQMCEDCEDTNVVYEDEYVRGELVGRGTIDRPCPHLKREQGGD